METNYNLLPEERRDLEGIVDFYLAKHRHELLLSPPSPEVSEGEYELGKALFGQRELFPFCVREDEWIRHMAVFGMSGAGKTNLGFLLCRTLLEHGRPFLIFDWKRNYRDLLQFYDTVKVFTVGRDISPLFLNVLRPPPGTPPAIWNKKLVAVMARVFNIKRKILLHKAIDAAYKMHGPDKAMFQHAREWLAAHQTKGRKAEWLLTTQTVVEMLCYKNIGRVFNSPSPMPLQELLDKPVVLEVDSLEDDEKSFLIQTILLWIHHYRMQEAQRETFKHAVIIEEAHNILSRDTRTAKPTIMDKTFREIRELGESLILFDQMPHKISATSLANTYCTIAMNQKLPEDVMTMRKIFLPNQRHDEGAQLFTNLPTGQAVVKLQGRWQKAFLVTFPKFELQKGLIGDEELRCRAVPSSEAKADQLEEEDIEEKPLPALARNNMAEGQYSSKPASRAGEDERRMIEDLIRYPTSTVSERYLRLRVAPEKGTFLLSSLVSLALITSAFVKLPSARVRVLKPTTKAASIVADIPPCMLVHETPQHFYWKFRAKEELEKLGAECEVEANLETGHRVDVLARHKGRQIAVEIENVHAPDFSKAAVVDRLIVVALSSALARKIEEQLKTLPDQTRSKIVVTTSLQFLASPTI